MVNQFNIIPRLHYIIFSRLYYIPGGMGSNDTHIVEYC